VFLKDNQWRKINSRPAFSIIHFALNIRSKLLEILQQNNIQDDELSVAAGMLLGVRDILSPELHQAYAGAGAMHILCVSGLHVGIIFMILNWLLGVLNYRKNGKLVKAIIIMLAIWFYALLTGFSPSVVRASTMFSFIIVGQNLNRHVNIFSSLSSSAFVLLIVDPTLLFDLGFQLSYAAVVSIVILQKPIASIWVPNNKLLFSIWQLIAVSIAAQIGTAPLSLYYFHQFPNLFIITNLIVIPAAYIIINLGILVLAFSFAPPVSAFLGKILSSILHFLNYLIINIEQLEFAVSRNIYISPTVFVFLILLIIFASIWILLKKRRLIFVNLFLLIGILTALLFNFDKRNEFIIYQSNRNIYMAIYSNRQAWIICDTSVYNKPEIMDFQVSGHELHKGIKSRNYYIIDSLKTINHRQFYLQYPYLKFNTSLLKFNNSNNNPSRIPNTDYLIYCNPEQSNTHDLDSIYNTIICANIPPWKLKPIIKQTDSLGIKVHQVKTDGAWRIYFD
jgi:competence protein ComEC